MRILCDEHVPPALVNALRSEGFEVATVGEAVELGSPDADVLEFAIDRGYVDLTNNTGFVDRDGHNGVFFYEDQQTPNRELLRAIRTVEDLLTDENIRNRTIVLPDGWA